MAEENKDIQEAPKAEEAKAEEAPKAEEAKAEAPKAEEAPKAAKKPAKAKEPKAEGGKKKKSKKKGDNKEEGSSKKAKTQQTVVAKPKDYVPRLLSRYREEAVPALMKKFEYKNPMQAPRLMKVVVNMGVGNATRNIKELEEAAEELAIITGQKPRMNRARVSVAAFKVREGMPVGTSVTLRGTRMWDFLDRMINVALPRVRDFRGLPTNAFDGRGNHNLGIREQLVFPEIDYTKVEITRGMNVTIVTSAQTDEECKELLTLIGMPFRKRKPQAGQAA